MLLVLGHYILIEYGYRRGQGAARQAQKPSISRVHPEKLKRIDSDDVGGVRILCPSGRQVRKYARPPPKMMPAYRASGSKKAMRTGWAK